MPLLHLVAGLLVAGGVFFLVVGSVGFIRLPDVFCRLHVTGVLDSLGAPLIMLGAAAYIGPQLASLKLVLGVIFLTGTSPLVAHLLARAAVEAGHQPGVIEDPGELASFMQRRQAIEQRLREGKTAS
jgi:multicomponent Na+:H+ antiporter subunit G